MCDVESAIRKHSVTIAAVCLALSGAGCQQQMADQPSLPAARGLDVFCERPIGAGTVPGTVARGHLEIDQHFTRDASREPTARRRPRGPRTRSPWARTFPEKRPAWPRASLSTRFHFRSLSTFWSTGRDRFMIYCVVCHDPMGTGRGKIVERGYTHPPSYHIPRLRSVPVGHIFAVITEGYGSMPSYAGQIPPRDRWAIVSYVRALQLSQHFPADQLTPEMKKEMSTATAGKESR